MLDKITWPVVALVTVVCGAIVGLSALHADTRIILEVLIALGLGGTLAGIAAVHGKVNGNIQALTTTIQDAMDKLYHAQPETPPTDTPES